MAETDAEHGFALIPFDGSLSAPAKFVTNLSTYVRCVNRWLAAGYELMPYHLIVPVHALHPGSRIRGLTHSRAATGSALATRQTPFDFSVTNESAVVEKPMALGRRFTVSRNNCRCMTRLVILLREKSIERNRLIFHSSPLDTNVTKVELDLLRVNSKRFVLAVLMRGCQSYVST